MSIKSSNHSSDINRWKTIPFILGYEVKLSNNPKLQHEICKQLTGKYPKWFIFTDWCEGCGCYLVPILPASKEYDKYEDAILNGTSDRYVFKGMITDLPDNFKKWVKDNYPVYSKDAPGFIKINMNNASFRKVIYPDYSWY